MGGRRGAALPCSAHTIPTPPCHSLEAIVLHYLEEPLMDETCLKSPLPPVRTAGGAGLVPVKQSCAYTRRRALVPSCCTLAQPQRV